MNHSAYHIKLDHFVGPLDLLLYLVQKNEIEIEQISLEHITQQFTEHLDSMKDLDLEISSEFMLMTAHLLYLKSQCLLPSSKADNSSSPTDISHPKWDLIKQLIEYKKFKEVAKHLGEKESKRALTYENAPCVEIDQDSGSEQSNQCAPIKLDLHELVQAFQKCLKRLEEQPYPLTTEEEDEHLVADKLAWMLKQLEKTTETSVEALFSAASSKAEMIIIFLAMLEAMKQRLIITEQAAPLSQIYIRRA